MKTELAQPRNQQSNYTTTMNTNDNYLQEYSLGNIDDKQASAIAKILNRPIESNNGISDDELMAMMVLDDEPASETLPEQPIIAPVKPVTARLPKSDTVAAVKAQNKAKSINTAIEKLISNCRNAKENEISAEAIYKHLPETMLDYTERSKSGYLPLRFSEWRYLPSMTENAFYQVVMSDIELHGEYQLVPFTFVLSDELYQKCLSSKSFTTYLRARIQNTFNKSISRIPKFWFTLEYEKPETDYDCTPTKKGTGTHPHIHGSILLRQDELKKSRDTFHKINNRANKDNHDLFYSIRSRAKCIGKYGRLGCDLNWPFYSGKMEGKTKRQSGQDTIMYASDELKKEAKLIYNRVSVLVG